MPDHIHTVHYEVQDTWMRVGTLAWTYVEITKEAYSHYLDDLDQPAKNIEAERDETYYSREKRLLQNSVKTVVFSGMALEAAIFDFSAIHLGDKYTTEVLDKLDVMQKWQLVPRLVCGKSLSEASPGLNALKTVIRARNALVHAKSLPLTGDYSSIERVNARSAQLERDVHECFKCIVLLSLELNALLGMFTGVLPAFDKRTRPMPEESLHKGLVRVIERARQIHARSEASSATKTQ